ncbi:DUF5642 family protein [Mycobacterium sp. SM1]|nr:DUF5642 family protein [Mycobacterium sp. SM1]
MPRRWPRVATLVLLLAVSCVCSAGCSSGPKTPSPGAPTGTAPLNPANIVKVAGALPRGYEVAKVTGISAPARLWGLTAASAARPPQCSVLADPARGRVGAARGVSGSGGGGVVDAVVVASPSGPVTPDPHVVTQCRQWAISGGHATARVHLIDPPHVDGVETLGMAADITTTAEGGAEILSHAYSFIAYLGDYYAFTTLIAEPGSADSPLAPQFAADLLVKTVSALRG